MGKNIWRGRIYNSDGTAINGYFLDSTIMTYDIFGPFQKRAEAERETTSFINEMLKIRPSARYGELPYRIIGTNGAFSAIFGPTVYNAATLFAPRSTYSASRDIPRRHVG
jgi:hypothetical protein